MNVKERIVVDPGVLTGKPVIKGRRLAVEFIIDLLAGSIAASSGPPSSQHLHRTVPGHR